MVVLQGFTVDGALKDSARAQTQRLDWVTHVVNEVEVLELGPERRRVQIDLVSSVENNVVQATQ